MQQWFAIHTHAKSEEKALHHLQRQGFEVYLPRYNRKRRHARRVDYVRTPLFPRYIFIHLDPAAQRWMNINSTVGVQYLVSHGERPASLPDGVVEAIRDGEDEDGLIAVNRCRFKKGDTVRVTDGAMEDMVGIFECMDDSERVILLLSLMGRQVQVKIATEQVSLAS